MIGLPKPLPNGQPGGTRGLLDTIKSSSSHPRRCPLARENNDFPEEICQLLYGKRRGIYRVLFTIREDTVAILFIRNGAQGPVTTGNWEQDTG